MHLRFCTRFGFCVWLVGGLGLTACDGNSVSAVDSGPRTYTFCGDRVDDDGDDLDEDCPATLPRDAPPVFDCIADAPENVLASAQFGANDQVASGCVYVYQGETGAFYVAVDIQDGPSPLGPSEGSINFCGYDFSARRHVFMTQSPSAACADLVYQHPDQTQNQLLSNDCRKMLRNLGIMDNRFNPDIQFLDGDLETQLTRLETFDVAEVACIGINGTDGEPYRNGEIFVVQASANWARNMGFTAQ